MDLAAKSITWGKEGHYVVIKESVHQKEIRIIYAHTPKNRTLKYWNKTNRIEVEDKQFNNNCRRLQYLIFNNG